MIAHLHVGDVRADRGDDAGELVPEHHRQRVAEVVLGEGEVRVTQSGRADVDQHLAAARLVDHELLDREPATDRGDDRGPHAPTGPNR